MFIGWDPDKDVTPGARPESLDTLLAQLVDGWALWDEHRDYYINVLIPELQSGKADATPAEKAAIEKLRRRLPDHQWASLPTIVDSFVQRRQRQRLATVADQRTRAQRAAEQAAADREAAERQRREAARAAQAAALERARRQREVEEQLRLEEERERELAAARAEKVAKITTSLSSALRQSLSGADQLNARINGEGLVDYQVLKARQVTAWLKSRLATLRISEEQAVAIGELTPAFLLRARAGSGKTSVIAGKALLLIELESVSPDHLIILAFNKKAASEVTRRIRKEFNLPEFNNARTFHSLAHQLVQPKGELLFDEGGGSTNLKKQSVYVQDLLNSVMNPAVLAGIYLFFREEMKELEDMGTFLSTEDYYVYRRNHVQETLGGQSVKSTGEKWLADFLFEHGIRYAYERVWFWGKDNYRPDFSLTTDGPAPNIVIEHWGIDLNDRAKKVPDHWSDSWEEYRAEIDHKRGYWQRYNEANPTQQVVFLETSIADLRGGREAFEDRLHQLLARTGMNLRRRSEAELQDAVVKHRIGRFSTMCLQYINRAKKQRLRPEEMGSKIAAATGLGNKTTAFLNIANNIYRRYQQALADEGKTDFDDLMHAAIDQVHQSKGQCQIRIEHDRVIAMNDLRWIMIDEYQDFSRLFYDLIDAIRTYNQDVNLFCVGDSWQAINAFAGSDLRFFDGFTDLVAGARVGDLLNNYRSEQPIVELGNHFMRDKGKPSKATIVARTGSIEVCATENVWIEQRTGPEYAKERISDARFQSRSLVHGITQQTDRGMRIGRMLKKCHAILTSTKYSSRTSFAILSRVDQLGAGYRSLRAFHGKLKETLLPEERKKFGDFDVRVHCGTVHSFKGLEADVVIILGVNKRNFPKVHPDNELYSIFGVTASDVLAEERRLFYVAITRARSDLYLLTESGRESEYLSCLGFGPASTSYARTVGFNREIGGLEADDDIPF